MSEVPNGGGGRSWAPLVVALLLLALPGYGIFQWFFCRLEVPPGHLAVLIAKTGEDLSDGEIMATREGQKGIQLETLRPGRHWLNPLLWETAIVPIVEVPPGKVGVLTRLFGEDPDTATTEGLLVPLAGPQRKGIVAEILAPGSHDRINPWAYKVELHDAVTILAGFVGVVCNLVGPEPAAKNSYLVAPGERGVQRDVLKPGTYYLNPYAVQVYPVDVRSQRLELSADPHGKPEDSQTADDERRNALVFPSSDGFEIEVKLTVEWSIDESRAPEVLVRIGVGQGESPMAEILHKTLIPALRGNARIGGSKYPAANYIAGESRTVFQSSIFQSLKAACEDQGIVIRSVLVNDIVPPQQIARPIRDREVAREELARNNVQLQQARAEQSLARETELVQQEQVKVESETEKEKRRIAAAGAQRVAVIEQEQLLVVAQADLTAAELQAGAILARGQAEADVIAAQNVAEAEALRASVEAFSTPSGFAAYTFARKVAPRVRTVFADPDGPFGAIFKELLQPTKKEERR
ncbi:MAG: hypothetical protein KIT58_09640 [Planctomycetota bacterium]|nr:hypothetical protein [Planctomycetota bacterium]